MNSFQEIFNHPFISQQAQQQHHFEQIRQVQDTAKALNDFFDGVDKIEPAYQNAAMIEFCNIIYNYFNKHS